MLALDEAELSSAGLSLVAHIRAGALALNRAAADVAVLEIRENAAHLARVVGGLSVELAALLPLSPPDARKTLEGGG